MASPVTRAWASLPLRLVLGLGFMVHGYPKAFDVDARAGFQGMLAQQGVPLPEVMAWVVGVVEFFGGLALILGLATMLVAAVSIIHMLVAMFLVHAPHGFAFTNEPPGVEVNLLYIAGFLAVLLAGPGPLSLDAFIKGRQQRETRAIRR